MMTMSEQWLFLINSTQLLAFYYAYWLAYKKGVNIIQGGVAFFIPPIIFNTVNFNWSFLPTYFGRVLRWLWVGQIHFHTQTQRTLFRVVQANFFSKSIPSAMIDVLGHVTQSSSPHSVVSYQGQYYSLALLLNSYNKQCHIFDLPGGTAYVDVVIK